jgi:hypothetical protein
LRVGGEVVPQYSILVHYDVSCSRCACACSCTLPELHLKELILQIRLYAPFLIGEGEIVVLEGPVKTKRALRLEESELVRGARLAADLADKVVSP